MSGYNPTSNVLPGGGYDFSKIPDNQSLARMAIPQQPVAPLGGIPGGQWLLNQHDSLAAYLQQIAQQAAGGFQNFAGGNRNTPYARDYNLPNFNNQRHNIK